MADETWHRARLIPTSGINGQEEAERRATSALLAVIFAVREFGVALLRPLGAPGGTVETFIETQFKLGDQTVIPDGLIRVTRGSKSWVALVEIKTGVATLSREQVECYLDVARENGFDAVLTISNELAARPSVHPVAVDGRKTRKVALAHLSWAEVLTAAVQQRVHRGVADPDQAWILAELIRYLEHQKSGALDFADMGSSWVEVREAVAAGTLRANDKGLPEVVARWNQLLRFVALRLGRELGAEVQVVEPRKAAADPNAFLKETCQRVVADGTLSGTVRIPNAIAPLNITADLRASRIEVSAEIEAPRDGRSLTRINWLLRQLRDAPDALRIDVWAANARTSVSERLSVLRENPEAVVSDPKKPPKTFRIALVRPLGSKRDAARGSFIASTLDTVDEFYSEVLQALRPWSAKPPQLAKVPPTAVEKAGIDLSQPPRDFEVLEPDSESGDGTGIADEPPPSFEVPEPGV